MYVSQDSGLTFFFISVMWRDTICDTIEHAIWSAVIKGMHWLGWGCNSKVHGYREVQAFWGKTLFWDSCLYWVLVLFLFIIRKEYILEDTSITLQYPNIRHECMPWVQNTATPGSPADSERQYSGNTIQIDFNMNGGPWGSSGLHNSSPLGWPHHHYSQTAAL